ncbi:MAG: MFS transporter [Reyranella sp.]|uniref:MFS transporter n=1 Tax=Reyranella sp. TaxID=1929291 RepID=UPI0027314C04|nr:MFS transporter [Reyranella sp.]MDP1961433.1 MFS transporter [Reyranella sp.]MDP2375346.1 MFS transporter [Reyranella sp.]
MVAAFHVGKVPPSIPSIREELGASLRQAGWLLSTVNLITALAGMAIALTADRFGHRRLVLLGTALCFAASLGGAFAGSVDTLLIGRVVEGLGFIAVTVALPTLLLRIASPSDQRFVMTLWTSYMPAGAGSMMLIAAVVLPGTSWRVAWLVASAASALMLAALLWRALPRRELDPLPVSRRPVLHEMAEVASTGGPLAIALCFGAYSCCWFAVIGFLPTLLIERLGFATSAAAIITALVTIVNVGGNLAAGWLMHRGMPRVAVIAGAAVSMAFCAAGVFMDGVPDLLRLVLAGVYSAVIGVVPGALFTALPVHAPRPELVGASTGLLMQGSNIGALLGPPITGALVASGGWPAAARLTSAALAIAAAAGLFLHWRERRKLSP